MSDNVEKHTNTVSLDDQKEKSQNFCTFRNSGGLRKTPTPGGVPVKMMSPGFNVMNLIKDNISTAELVADFHVKLMQSIVRQFY